MEHTRLESSCLMMRGRMPKLPQFMDDLKTRRDEKRVEDQEASAAKYAHEEAEDTLQAQKEKLEEEQKSRGKLSARSKRSKDN